MGALRIQAPTHEAKRHALLRLVGVVAPHAIVFFDARQAPSGILDSVRELDVRVIYCREREADAFILDHVRDATNAAQIVVVTNDREVAGKAVQLGARSRGVAEFFAGRAATDASSSERDAGEAIRQRTWQRLHYKPEDFGLPDEVDLERPEGDLREDPTPPKKRRRKRR